MNFLIVFNCAGFQLQNLVCIELTLEFRSDVASVMSRMEMVGKILLSSSLRGDMNLERMFFTLATERLTRKLISFAGEWQNT